MLIYPSAIIPSNSM